MSSPPARPRFTPRERTGGRGGVATFVLKTAWLAAIVFGVYYLMNMRRDGAAPVAAAPNPQAQSPPVPATNADQPKTSVSTPTPETLQNVELTTAASIQRQQLTAAKFKQRQLVAAYDEVKLTLDEWEKELAAWEKLGPPLLKSDDGKRIASDGELVTRYRVLLEEERPGRDALAAARSQAEELVSPVREAMRNAEDASTPNDDLARSLRDIQAKARKARDSYRAARQGVSALLAQASGSGEKTLADAIAAKRGEEATERAAFIAAEEKKARDEGARVVAAEKVKLAQTEAELEAGRIRDLAEQKRQGLLHSGSTWKGSLTSEGATCPSTLVVAKREKDAVSGTITWNYVGYGRRSTVAFEGTVRGTSLKLRTTKPLEGNPLEGVTYDMVYDPVGRTLSGTYSRDGQVNGRYAYRYSTGQEE